MASIFQLVMPFHDRMPVILPQDVHEQWLNPAETPEELIGLLKPYAPSSMAEEEVSTLVNSPKNDRPECLQPPDKAE